MTDLSGIINMASPENVLDVWYESQNVARTRLGLSEVGHPCNRYLWYRHQGLPLPTPDGRVLRLFELGNVIEEHLIADLRKAGYTIDGQQTDVVLSYGDVHLLGHTDGIIEGLAESSAKHLLEIKTANEKSFKALVKCRSYEKWNPKYKGQVHAYMMGLTLRRALVIVYNKNTSEVYSERIKYDREYAIDLMTDVFNAITAETEPERKCPRADWFEAKWCGYYKTCWNQ